jgi:TonB family protein
VGHTQEAAPVISEELRHGIKLYQEGDMKGAIESLSAFVKQHPEDADAWSYLSLALFRSGDLKEARKAFETLVKLRPNDAAAHSNLAYTLLVANKSGDAKKEAKRALELDAQNAQAHYVLGTLFLNDDASAKALEESTAALKISPNFALAQLLQSQALLNLYIEGFSYPVQNFSLLKTAAESLDRYLKLDKSAASSPFWQEQLETLRTHASLGDRLPTNRSLGMNKAHVLTRPEPGYTDEARAAGIRGKVVLHAVFTADGMVKHILVIRSLSHGLTEQCVKAARKIKFVPATKDGHPVSQFIQIEYNFL